MFLQPQVPLRLPCYDFTPITDQCYVHQPQPFLVYCLLIHLGTNWLSERDGRCVQSPRTNSPRRTDSRLLAIPISRTQVSGYDSYLGRIYSVARILYGKQRPVRRYAHSFTCALPHWPFPFTNLLASVCADHCSTRWAQPTRAITTWRGPSLHLDFASVIHTTGS